MQTKKYLNIKYEKEYLEIAEQIKNRPVANIEMHTIGFFLLTVINRAMVTSMGIETLLRVENYECALPLLRVLMDCGIQIKTATMVDNKDEYYSSFGDAKTKRGKRPLGEGAVVKSLDEDKWATKAYDLYKFLCKFVHLSRYHAKLLLSSDLSRPVPVGRLALKEDKKFAAEIEQCYDEVSMLLIGIFEYYKEKE